MYNFAIKTSDEQVYIHESVGRMPYFLAIPAGRCIVADQELRLIDHRPEILEIRPSTEKPARFITRNDAIEILADARVKDRNPIMSLSIKTGKTTCLYNLGLDPYGPPAPPYTEIGRLIDANGFMKCPVCRKPAPVYLVNIGDGPSVYPPRDMLYARLVHDGCTVVTETECVNVP